MMDSFEITLPMILLGVALTILTIFIHRHTFVQDYEMGYYRRIKFPLWLALVIVIVGQIPFVNLIAFMAGGLAYIMKIAERQDFTFSFRNITGKYPEHTGTLWKKITKFFNKNLS